MNGIEAHIEGAQGLAERSTNIMQCRLEELMKLEMGYHHHSYFLLFKWIPTAIFFSWNVHYRTCCWRYVPLASHHHWSKWQSLCWGCFPCHYPFPTRLSFQTPKGNTAKFQLISFAANCNNWSLMCSFQNSKVISFYQ